ncbi:MAG: response regulator [Myxococcaceae bacterium]|nr:response regulator [Myxococcaceae bacterium]
MATPLEGIALALVEGAPDGVVVSHDGTVLFANEAAARMLGYESPRAMEGVPLSQWLLPDEAQEMGRRIHAMLTTGARFPPREYGARKLDGSPLRAEITSTPFLWEGRPAIVAFARDVTERSRMQARLALTDRLVALGTLAAGVAHEINNPMTAVHFAAEALERSLVRQLRPVPPEVTTLLGDLKRGAERVTSLVRDLKQFSRPDDEQRRPVTLRDVLEQAVRLVGHALRHRATLTTHHAEAPAALGMPGRIEQVAVNLLLNASQALPEGRKGNRVELRSFATSDGRAAFSVQDNGVGISARDLPHVFEPFFTTKPVGEGTGLGLAISHNIVTQLGGELLLESVQGQGTTVTVIFPPASSAPIIAPERRPAPAGRSATLLLIDDEPMVLASLRAVLSDQHQVTVCSRVQEAVALLESGAAFDLVLCDVMMPESDGLVLHEQVRTRWPQLAPRFAFMTGGVLSLEASQRIEASGRPVLEKPFRPQAVEALLAMLSPEG